MSKIYTIMTMTDLTYDDRTKFPEFGATRLVGWYYKFDDAYSSVLKNNCDINETCYQYALIEECEEGIYHPAMKRWWLGTIKGKDNMKKL